MIKWWFVTRKERIFSGKTGPTDKKEMVFKLLRKLPPQSNSCDESEY